MTSPFSEAELVERPAMDLLASLGWAVVDATGEVFGADGTLGRSTAAEVVLRPRLRAALARLNPLLASEGLTQAEEALTRDRGAMMSLLAANRELYELVKQGVLVEVPDGKGGSDRDPGQGHRLGPAPGQRLGSGPATHGHRAALYLPARHRWLRQWTALGADRVQGHRRAGSAGLRRQLDQL